MYRYHSMRRRPPGTFSNPCVPSLLFPIHYSPTPTQYPLHLRSRARPCHPANATVSVPGAPYISFLIRRVSGRRMQDDGVRRKVSRARE